MTMARSDEAAGIRPSTLVLVIDGDEHARFIYRSMFSHHGYEVVTVADAAAGLHVCDGSPPDAVVIDIDPPTCASLDVVRTIAQHPRFRGAVVATTRRAMLHEQRDLRGLRVRAILVKPVDPKKVLDAVRGSYGASD